MMIEMGIKNTWKFEEEKTIKSTSDAFDANLHQQQKMNKNLHKQIYIKSTLELTLKQFQNQIESKIEDHLLRSKELHRECLIEEINVLNFRTSNGKYPFLKKVL